MSKLAQDRKIYAKISKIFRNNPQAYAEVAPATEAMLAKLNRKDYSEAMELIGTILYCLPLDFDGAVELFAQTVIHTYLTGENDD